MFANAYQRGFLCILSSVGSRPLCIWSSKVRNGHIKRVIDQDIKSLVLEITGTNVATTYIYSPLKEKEDLGIRLPFFIMIIKNLKRYFSFEIEILDDKSMRRRFRVSNYQSQTSVRPFSCMMPLCLNSGWNQVQFNLADFTRRAYGSSYLETRRIQIHANCRIRCIYFADRIYPEDKLPPEFKLYMPLSMKAGENGLLKKAGLLKHPSKEQLDKETATDDEMHLETNGKSIRSKTDIATMEAKEIVDMLSDLVITKVHSMSKEISGQKLPEETKDTSLILSKPREEKRSVDTYSKEHALSTNVSNTQELIPDVAHEGEMAPPTEMIGDESIKTEEPSEQEPAEVIETPSPENAINQPPVEAADTEEVSKEETEVVAEEPPLVEPVMDQMSKSEENIEAVSAAEEQVEQPLDVPTD